MHSLDELQVTVILLKIPALVSNIHTVAQADGYVLCSTFLNWRQIRKLNSISNHVLTGGQYLSSCSQGWAGALFCFCSTTSCSEWKIILSEAKADYNFLKI